MTVLLALLAMLQAAPAPAPAPAITDGAPAPAVAGDAPLGAIGRQQLPASGCAAYLWSAGERHVLVAMASAAPARLRVSVGGRIVDLPRVDAGPAGSFGLPALARYAAGDVQASLDLTVAADPALTQGGTVPGGTITLVEGGRDAVVVPVAGLVGCAA